MNGVAELDIDQLVASNLLNFRLNPEDTEDFDGLVASIQKHGLIYPLIVRVVEEESTSARQKYEIVSGYRRFSACKMLGIRSIQCNIVGLNDRNAYEVALIDNIQRQTLNPIEEAEAFKTYLTCFGKGRISELAIKIGKSEEYVTHRLLLLKLPNVIMKNVSRRLLRSAESTELVWLKDPQKQIELANEITTLQLSFRQTRSIIKLLKGSPLLSVKEAVKQVTEGRSQSSSASSNLQEAEEVSSNAWATYRTDKRSKDVEVLCHAMLVLRSCLAGMDMLVEKAESADIRKLMLKERVEVHDALDEIIRYSVK
ncbi:MAG: ParB/RepB/Spo0J family partition protein [Nitrososphaerales archaeon]